MNPTFEQVIEVIRQLPPPEREKVKDWLEHESNGQTNQSNDFEEKQRRFRRSMQWIQENRLEFDGQWVALDGETLLAHGTDGKKVHREAQSKGGKTPLMHRVSLKETQPFGGW
ncbi:hypothetical protein BH20ACI1_BH20ACI1_19500 [soil metagenome]